MNGPADRRTFLRRLGLSAVGAPLAASACAPDGPPASPEGASALDATSLTRPVLRPWSEDIVHMVAPPEELPVAYVSMALKEVYVDHEYRDRAAWLLRAHISVSTLVWRIPLPGDPEGQPVVPGDEAREFEELSMRAWDPALRPAMDDIRILRGGPVTRRVDLRCVPLVGDVPGRPPVGGAPPEERWISAAPFEVAVVDPGRSGTDSFREDFRIVGTALRHDDRECRGAGEAVQLVSWAVP